MVYTDLVYIRYDIDSSDSNSVRNDHILALAWGLSRFAYSVWGDVVEYLRIENDFGTTLIDDNYSNMVLIKKASVTSTGAPGMVQVCTVEFPLGGGSIPLIAVKAAGFIQIWRNDPGTLSGMVKWVFMVEGGYKQDMEYFLFRPSTEYPVAGTGLIVIRNAKGNVIYDSDANYASIVDFVTLDYRQQIRRSYSPGRKYALSVARPCVRKTSSISPGGWGTVWAVGGKVVNGIGVFEEWKYRPTIQGGNGTLAGGNPTASFLVLDVTGF